MTPPPLPPGMAGPRVVSGQGAELPGSTRLTARTGRPPLGAFLAGAGLVGTALVGLLHLDRIPLSICFLKFATGCPCPTCGATRAVGRLFARDPAGALAMNPLVTVTGFVIALWGLADLVLWPWGRALSLELSPGASRLARVGAVALILANWVYLIADGR